VRSDIAGELHDCALQLVITAHRDLQQGAACEREAISRTRASLDAAIAEIRRISNGEAAPSVDERGGLDEALRELCRDAGRRAALITTLDVELRALDSVHRDLLFVLAREFAENTVKHAAAVRLDIVLRVVGDRLELVVTDDGTGIPRERWEGGPPVGHHGLRLARHRVQGRGGSLTIEVGPEGGTTTTVRLPLDEAGGG
jgi:signal transduction histidine kinase